MEPGVWLMGLQGPNEVSVETLGKITGDFDFLGFFNTSSISILEAYQGRPRHLKSQLEEPLHRGISRWCHGMNIDIAVAAKTKNCAKYSLALSQKGSLENFT